MGINLPGPKTTTIIISQNQNPLLPKDQPSQCHKRSCEQVLSEAANDDDCEDETLKLSKPHLDLVKKNNEKRQSTRL